MLLSSQQRRNNMQLRGRQASQLTVIKVRLWSPFPDFGLPFTVQPRDSDFRCWLHILERWRHIRPLRPRNCLVICWSVYKSINPGWYCGHAEDHCVLKRQSLCLNEVKMLNHSRIYSAVLLTSSTENTVLYWNQNMWNNFFEKKTYNVTLVQNKQQLWNV